MKLLLNILKWILIIAFFPLSLVVVAYFRQRRKKREYFRGAD